MTIAVLGTLDSKGHEHAFVADLIRNKGHEVLLIDLGSGGAPQITPDITRFEVAAAIDAAAVTATTRQQGGSHGGGGGGTSRRLM